MTSHLSRMLTSYCSCREEEKRMVAIVAGGCERFRSGYSSLTWSTLEIENLIARFNFIVNRQHQIHAELTQHYFHKIAVAVELDSRNTFREEYVEIVKRMLKEATACYDSLVTLTPEDRDTSSFEVIHAMVGRVVTRLNDQLFKDFRRDYLNGH